MTGKRKRPRLQRRQRLQKYVTNANNKISHLNPGRMDYLRMKDKPRLEDMNADFLFRAAQLGLTSDQIAHIFGVSINRYYKALKERPELKSSLLAGKGLAIQYAAEKLWEKIEGGSLGAIMFYLRTQARWSTLEKNVVQIEEGSYEREEAKNALGRLDDTDLNTLGQLLAKARQAQSESEGASSQSTHIDGPSTVQ